MPRSKPLTEDDPRHGQRWVYIHYGCRCPKCTKANREYHDVVMARLNARRVAGDPNLPHGTTGGYSNWGCRCSECCAAHARQMILNQLDRHARTREGSPDVPHGTASGYNGWGCRCEKCRTAGGYGRSKTAVR